MTQHGKCNKRRTAFVNLSYEEIVLRARDMSLPVDKRREFQAEEKERRRRNKQKRKNSSGAVRRRR